jgi:hypothetical protein
VSGQDGNMTSSVEVTWRGSGRHMSGNDRGIGKRGCDRDREMGEWRIGVGRREGGKGEW